MDYAPPNAPWQEIQNPTGAGYLSVYYSDDLSPLPVRFVTKPGDNKSDPNLETLTYGLFSTCSPSMRSSLVRRHAEYIFFTTMRPAGRVLSGFYRIRWFATANSPRKADFYLAADSAHFVAAAPSLREVDRACRTNLNRRFRNTLLLDATQCTAVGGYLMRLPNALPAYLAEIDRLERFSRIHSGFRYPSWKRKEKFDWSGAAKHLQPPAAAAIRVVANASPSGKWKCNTCSAGVENKALLRQCPSCGTIGTLQPA